MQTIKGITTEDYYKSLLNKIPQEAITHLIPVKKSKCSTLFCCPKRKRALKNNFLSDIENLLKIATLKYEPDDEQTLCALRTIYIQLIDKTPDLTRINPHWEDIGFQGPDPSTDLRSTGLLSIYQMLEFVDNNLTLAKAIFLYSVDKKTNFPYMLAGINLTKMVIDYLRDGTLDSLIQEQKDVVKAANLFYIGLWNCLYNDLKSNERTISEFHLALNNVQVAGKSPLKVVTEYHKISQKIQKEVLSSFILSKSSTAVSNTNNNNNNIHNINNNEHDESKEEILNHHDETICGDDHHHHR
jgi:hypothetical protein